MWNSELFNKSLDKGKTGEEAAINYFMQQGKKVIDVSDNDVYRNKDIDLIVNNVPIEVKTDTHISTKLFVEVITNVKNNTDGWFKKSEAHFMFYFFSNMGVAYMFSLNQLRGYINKNNYPLITTKPKDDYKQVQCYLIPIGDLMGEISINKINIRR